MKQPKKILYYGKDEPLAKQIEIKAGPLNLFYEAGDLRYIKFNEKEIVRRVYVAVRDHNWDTIIPAISNIQVNSSIDSFKITYDVKHIQNDVNFIWKAEIVGKSDGSIKFNMLGEALTTFWRNRIGFCILLPMDYAESKTQINHVDGTVEASVFPKYIAPQLIIEGKPSPVEPFSNMRGLIHKINPKMMAELHFEGDVFEFEVFHPDRLASRILGMGDVVSLVEKAQENLDEEESVRVAEKMLKAEFDFDDFLSQMKQMKKMGSMGSIAKMLPGMGNVQVGDKEEAALGKHEAIILSMTK